MYTFLYYGMAYFSQGPFSPKPGYFIILALLIAYPVFVFKYLLKRIPGLFSQLLKRRYGFIVIFSVLSLFLLMVECGFRISGIADWGGGQGPLQKDWRLRNYTLNEEGFRGPEIQYEKKKNVIRIMGFGDSFGFGQGVQWEDTYLEQLRIALLRERPDIRIETLNKAKPGWNTVQQYNYARATGIKFSPDIFIILFVLNDPEFRGYTLTSLTRLPIEPYLWRSHVYFYLVRAYNMIRYPYNEYIKNLYKEGSQTSEYCQRSLIEFGKLARKDKIFIILAICPILSDFDNYEFAYIHKKISAWGSLSELFVVDLLPSFKQANIPAHTLRVSSQDWHPNATGHKIIADVLQEKIIKYFGKVKK